MADYNFSINCGGDQLTSSDGIVYEKENETLGPATYYVPSSKRWAVSNIGLFTGNSNPQYKSSSPHSFTNTLDSELFQSTRLSASSLRYYGLGLENGNYTVTLQFSETAYEDARTWKSLGRRIFDIYVQVHIIFFYNGFLGSAIFHSCCNHHAYFSLFFQYSLSSIP